MGRREYKALAEGAGDLRQRDGRIGALAVVLAASDLREIRTGRRWCDPFVDPAVEHIDEGFHEAAEIECFRYEIGQRSLPGIDFQSMDGKPAHLFFLLVAPENSAGIHLKALARISRLMKDQTFRKRLMEADSSEEIYSLFSEGDEKY